MAVDTESNEAVSTPDITPRATVRSVAELEHRLTARAKTAEDRIEALEERCKSFSPSATRHDLHEMEKRLMMTSDQLEKLLDNQTTQIGKIAKEQSDRFDALTKAVADLQAIIDAGGTITPAVETAVANVQTALDSLDASIPDAPA